MSNNQDLYTRTASGKKFHPYAPAPEQIEFLDIAAGLSKICRYTGQCPRFYSVAEHSMHVAELVPEELRFAALMHDATEAYLSDIAKPIKVGLYDYQRVEKELAEVIETKFYISLTPSERVTIRDADWAMLCLEFKTFFPNHYEEDVGYMAPETLPDKELYCYKIPFAEWKFIHFFNSWR